MSKTISFAIVHFSVAFSVAYMLTGDVLIGGFMALIEPMLNTIAYHFHEKIWDRFKSRSFISITGFRYCNSPA